MLRRPFGAGDAPASVSPEEAAEEIARNIGEMFSSARFDELFNGSELAAGWSRDDALLVWYSLGDMVLTVSAWASDHGRDAPSVIDCCRPALWARWGFSGQALEAALVALERVQPEAILGWGSCSGGGKGDAILRAVGELHQRGARAVQ